MQDACIAVFGSSEPVPGERLYAQAYETGRCLAGAGYTVVTGGYGGVMEAASRGAREAGGRVVGVTCAIFAARRPNTFLSETVTAPDLHSRQQWLIERAQGYVVLPGKAGTLAELTLLWALARAGCLGARPVILLGGPWPTLWAALRDGDWLGASELAITRFARDPGEVVRLLAEGALDENGD